MIVRNLSIKRRLILMQMLVVFVVLVLFSVFYVLNDARVYRDSVKTKLSSMAKMIGHNCSSALNFRDRNDAAKTLASLDVESQMTHAWVLDSEGRVFAAYWKPGQDTLTPIAGEGDYQEMKGDHLILARKIVQDGEVIGFVVLRYHLDRFWQILLRNYLMALLALAGGMGIALLLALLTHRALSAPILRLVDTVDRVSSSKDLSIRMTGDRQDELGVLYRGFNTMLAEIQAREQELDLALTALRESEEKYRSLVEHAKDGIVIIQDGRFVYANPSLVAMSGSTLEELIGTPFVQHVAPEEIPKLKRYYQNRLAGMATDSMYETIFRARDGQRIHAEVNAALIPYQGREADLVIIRNINERKKAEAEIRQLNETLELRVQKRTRELAEANARLIELDRMKSMFLASMSHELRTPLNSILGFTGLLLMGMSGPLNEEQTKQLSLVQTGATHLLHLINDILDISKIESGRVDLQIQPFPVVEVVDECLTAVAPLARGKGLELAKAVPGNPVMESDRRRFKQVLMNLLGNAIKFSERGEVRVEVGTLNGELSVSVSDRGIGIRMEDLSKLFNPFQQIDMSSTKVYEGTGLGLYLCKKILGMLGGTIAVRSEYGHGSMFTFTLPIQWKEIPSEESARR